MPQRGDKLYSCFNGTLEVAVFLEESVADGATVPTWLVRNNEGVRVRVSTDFYQTSKRAAYEKYARELAACLPSWYKALDDAKAGLAHAMNELGRVGGILREMNTQEGE